MVDADLEWFGKTYATFPLSRFGPTRLYSTRLYPLTALFHWELYLVPGTIFGTCFEQVPTGLSRYFFVTRPVCWPLIGRSSDVKRATWLSAYKNKQPAFLKHFSDSKRIYQRQRRKTSETFYLRMETSLHPLCPLQPGQDGTFFCMETRLEPGQTELSRAELCRVE